MLPGAMRMNMPFAPTLRLTETTSKVTGGACCARTAGRTAMQTEIATHDANGCFIGALLVAPGERAPCGGYCGGRWIWSMTSTSNGAVDFSSVSPSCSGNAVSIVLKPSGATTAANTGWPDATAATG